MSATETIVLEQIQPRREYTDPELAAESPYAKAPDASLPQTPVSPRSDTGSPSPPPDTDREVTALLPADRGKAAWTFLIAGTIIETSVWGLLNAVGVLQQYWTTEKFKGDESTVTLATSLMNGLSYMSAGFFGPLFAAFPHQSKTLQIIGLVIATAGLLGSAFVSNAQQLIGTVGVLFPFSAALYLPCATMVYEWFYEKRGLATGIMCAGTGVGGTLFPIMLDAMLKKFGYKATMLSLGVGFFAVNSVSLIAIRRRIPLAPVSAHRRARIEWRHLLTWAFACGFLVLLLTSLGNFNPTLWIPTFTDAVGALHPGGIALVSIMNAASVPGNALVGYLSDRTPVRIMISMTMTLAALSVLLPWGFGTTTAPLIVFSILWGMTALSFPGLYSKIITPIAKDDPMLPMLVFSIFATLRGVGNVTAGPISNKLIQTAAFRGAAGAYGTNFGAVLIYTAVTTFLGGFIGFFFPA